MMITEQQLIKALHHHGTNITALTANRVMNELMPNPQSGFGVGGVEVWGDEKSIKAVRQWHHDSTAVVPALLSRIQEMQND